MSWRLRCCPAWPVPRRPRPADRPPGDPGARGRSPRDADDCCEGVCAQEAESRPQGVPCAGTSCAAGAGGAGQARPGSRSPQRSDDACTCIDRSRRGEAGQGPGCNEFSQEVQGEEARPGSEEVPSDRAPAQSRAAPERLSRGNGDPVRATRAPDRDEGLVGRPPSASQALALRRNDYSLSQRVGRTKRAIRSRLLAAIRSTWGGPRDGSVGWTGNGTIRIATWSFNDKQIARALVGAHQRGVSVQVIAARGPNRDHRAWRWLRHRLGARPTNPSVRQSADRVSFARQCRGSCRGGRHAARQVHADRQGRAVPGAPRGHPDLDEPDQAGLPGAVEPGTVHALGSGVRRLHEGLQASEARRKGRNAVPHPRRWGTWSTTSFRGPGPLRTRTP